MIGFLLDGGWMMLALLACSMVLVATIIDRIRVFRAAAKTDSEKIAGEVCSAVRKGDLDAAEAACTATEGPLAAVLFTGVDKLRRLREKGETPKETEAGVVKAMEEYAPKAMGVLEKRLGLLVLISSVSPLIGMCGTVTGMINSFSVMAESAGLDPSAVAGGISEALITTAAGLIIAIPGVILYNVFQRKTEEWTVRIETAVTEFAEAVGA